MTHKKKKRFVASWPAVNLVTGHPSTSWSVPCGPSAIFREGFSHLTVAKIGPFIDISIHALGLLARLLAEFFLVFICFLPRSTEQPVKQK